MTHAPLGGQPLQEHQSLHGCECMLLLARTSSSCMASERSLNSSTVAFHAVSVSFCCRSCFCSGEMPNNRASTSSSSDSEMPAANDILHHQRKDNALHRGLINTHEARRAPNLKCPLIQREVVEQQFWGLLHGVACSLCLRCLKPSLEPAEEMHLCRAGQSTPGNEKLQ